MLRITVAAASLLATGCSAGGQELPIRKLESERVDNLLVMPRVGDHTHFAGAAATFAVKGRCLVALTELGDRTPIFPLDGNLAVTDAGVVHAGEQIAAFGEATGIWGHDFFDLKAGVEPDLGSCPRAVVYFTSIRQAGRARPITERPPA